MFNLQNKMVSNRESALMDGKFCKQALCNLQFRAFAYLGIKDLNSASKLVYSSLRSLKISSIKFDYRDNKIREL